MGVENKLQTHLMSQTPLLGTPNYNSVLWADCRVMGEWKIAKNKTPTKNQNSKNYKKNFLQLIHRNLKNPPHLLGGRGQDL